MRRWICNWIGRVLAPQFVFGCTACAPRADTYSCVDRIEYRVWGTGDMERWGFETHPAIDGIVLWEPRMGIEVTDDSQAGHDSIGGWLGIERRLEPPKSVVYSFDFDATIPLSGLPARIPLKPATATVILPREGPNTPVVCEVPLVGTELSLVRASGAATFPLPEDFERLYHGVVPELDTECVKASGFQFEFQLTKERLREPFSFDLCDKK